MTEAKPDWVKMKPAEVEKIIIDLANEGNAPAKIGTILRDKHGIPKVKLLGLKVIQVLHKAKVPVKAEVDIVLEKIKNVESHIAKNKHDYPAHRSHTKKLWIVNKLNKQNSSL
ncbi:MAG: hypothetical protein WCK90_02295 [archaeon]